jgi:2-aminobenzoate-CoA ligase
VRDALPPVETWPELLFTLPALSYPPTVNCAEVLLDDWIARGRGAARCLIADTETWSYADLMARANQVAHVLVADLGLVPGNRVLLRGPNNPWLVACWFAVLKAGGVVVTTMPLLRGSELRTIIDMGVVELALGDHRFLDDLELAGGRDLTIVGYGGAGHDDLIRLASPKPIEFVNVRTAADDVCMLAFTSGTTGRPKATMHFHRDVLAIADTFSMHVVRPGPDDIFTGSPPLAFTYGLGGVVVFPMRAGAAAVLLEKAGPDQLLEAIGRHRVTTLFTSATAYRAMTPMLPDGGLSSLRRCVSAGEALPTATWDAFHRASGMKIIDGIGSTEMLHIFISAAGDDIRPGATGTPVPGYVAEVQDDDGRAVPDGELGHLAVKGPTGCRYLHGDRQSEYVKRGWNVTGDTFVRDRDGYFWYQARSDDMIVSSGYNIAGPEVEEAILRHPDVAEVAVVGVPDEARGVVVKAFVVLRDTAAPTMDARTLQDFVKTQIAPYKYPRALEFVDSLPRTLTGKLQRYRLRTAAD